MLDRFLSVLVLSLIVLSGPARAAAPGVAATPGGSATYNKGARMVAAAGTRGEPAPSRNDAQAPADALVFSAPPRETAQDGARIYQPVAEYLGKIIGRKIVYRHPGNRLTYQDEMLKGEYDIVFDGPHFNSWRMTNLQHRILARLADEHAFAVIVPRDNTRIGDVKQLAGQRASAE